MGKASRRKGVVKGPARGRPGGTAFAVAVVVILAIGVGLIALARNDSNASAGGERPGLQDHWHAAYVVDICGTNEPKMPEPPKLLGLHTHNDGLIHVEPYVTGSVLDRGRNATLARFVEGEPGFKLTSNEVQVPGGHPMRNGDKCDGRDPGQVTIRVWPDVSREVYKDYTNPKDVKIIDNSAITVAFVPPGTPIGKPPSIANLANPNAGEGG
ncbi:MAG TPA: hypothetical protein VHL53_23140 [Acidimicrobiia bacterium]|nr:hypothetical protein [Acidimicrobiia bacterium]